MVRVLVLLLLLPFQLLGQNPKLDAKGLYEKAVEEYIRLHPEDLATTSTGKTLFVKQQDYTNNLSNTINDITIVYINTDEASQVLPKYFSKKAKFIILDMRQFFARSTVNFVYNFPTKYSWNPKKKYLSEPEYLDRYCKSDFDVKLEGEVVNYYFANTTCTNGK